MDTETPVVIPPGMMPGKHGGVLRRGGGRLPAKEKVEAIDFFRQNAAEVARALVVRAMKGDTRAIELVLAYAVGKPSDKVELSGPDGGPIQSQDLTNDDHERAALRDAIRAQLALKHPAGETAGDPEQAAVADPAKAGAGTP